MYTIDQYESQLGPLSIYSTTDREVWKKLLLLCPPLLSVSGEQRRWLRFTYSKHDLCYSLLGRHVHSLPISEETEALLIIAYKNLLRHRAETEYAKRTEVSRQDQLRQIEQEMMRNVVACQDCKGYAEVSAGNLTCICSHCCGSGECSCYHCENRRKSTR